MTGNVGGLLALLVTAAWLDDRRQNPRAGVWLATAASVKPFLFFVMAGWVWRRQWKPLVVSAATVAAWVAAGWWLVGPDAYAQWVHQIGRIDWYDGLLNMSVWRLIYRFPSWPRALVWGLAGAVMAATSLPIRDLDRRWAALILSALWLSPLGWLYYGWIALAPVAIQWRSLDRRLAVPALIGLCIPPLWPHVPVLSVVYPVATLLLWLAIVSVHQEAEPLSHSTTSTS